jgi:hypothetical protein
MGEDPAIAQLHRLKPVPLAAGRAVFHRQTEPPTSLGAKHPHPRPSAISNRYNLKQPEAAFDGINWMVE